MLRTAAVVEFETIVLGSDGHSRHSLATQTWKALNEWQEIKIPLPWLGRETRNLPPGYAGISLLAGLKKKNAKTGESKEKTSPGSTPGPVFLSSVPFLRRFQKVTNRTHDQLIPIPPFPQTVQVL